MSAPPSAADRVEQGAPRTWAERLAGLAGAAQSLIATRLEIFQAELEVKTRDLGKGLAGFFVAAAFGFGAMLLLAALLAAALAKLFGSVVLGILAAMLLYAAGAAAAGYFGWKALSQVKPTEFPATSRELARDADAISAALMQDADPEEGPEDPYVPTPSGDVDSEIDVRDLEARLREGAE